MLVFGFLDNRFVGDFIPLLVIGCAVGLAVAWQYTGIAGAAARFGVTVTGDLALCAYSLAVNFGMSIAPTGWWSQQQTAAFVRAQERVGSVLGVRRFRRSSYTGTSCRDPDPLARS